MPEQASNFIYPWERDRPGMITLASLILFSICLFYLVKFNQAIQQWDTLASLQLTVPPLYLLLDAAWRASAGGFLSWSLWVGKPWSRLAGMIISLAFAAGTWIDLFFLAEPTTLITRWPFNLTLTLLGLPGFWLILNREESRAYFHRNPVKIP